MNKAPSPLPTATLVWYGEQPRGITPLAESRGEPRTFRVANLWLTTRPWSFIRLLMVESNTLADDINSKPTWGSWCRIKGKIEGFACCFTRCIDFINEAKWLFLLQKGKPIACFSLKEWSMCYRKWISSNVSGRKKNIGRREIPPSQLYPVPFGKQDLK